MLFTACCRRGPMSEVSGLIVLSLGRLCLLGITFNGELFTAVSTFKPRDVCPHGASFLSLLRVTRGRGNGVPVSCNLRSLSLHKHHSVFSLDSHQHATQSFPLHLPQKRSKFNLIKPSRILPPALQKNMK